MTDPAYERLCTALKHHWVRWGRTPPLDGLTIMVSERPTGLLHSLYRASFCAVLQGSKISLLGDRVFRYDAGKCLIASMDLPVTAQVVEASADQPYMAFSLAIDPAMVADLLIGQPAMDVEPPMTTMAVGRLDPTLLDPMARLFELIDSPRDLAVIGPLIRREIVWRLLHGEHGPMLRQIGLADSRAGGWIAPKGRAA